MERQQTAVREIKEEIGLNTEKLTYIQSYYYDKKNMLMLGYRADIHKADFVLSSEVDSAGWVLPAEASSRLREGSITWKPVQRI